MLLSVPPLPTAQPPAYDAAAHIPPPPLPATATLTPKGVLYLSKALMLALDLGAGQAIDLLPPMPGSWYWHLDVRTSARYRIDWSGALTEAKRAQSPRVRGLKLPEGLVTQNTTLYLQTTQPYYPDFYPLLPDAYFATKQTPPLAA